MKTILLISILCAMLLRPAVAQYQHAFGTVNAEAAKSIQLASDSGFVIAGRSSSPILGGGDATVVKTNAAGALQWRFVYGGNEYDEFNSIRQLPNVVNNIKYAAVGTTKSFGNGEQVYLVGLSPAGIPVFSKTFGGDASDRAHCLQNIKDPTFGRGYVIVGETTSYSTFNAGSNVYVLLTDVFGNFQRAVVIGSGNGDERGFWIEQTNDGGYILVGSTTNICATSSTLINTDIFVVRLRSDLSILWSRTFGRAGSDANDVGNCIRENTDGTFMITGITHSFGVGNGDSYLLKISAGGAFIWMRTYGGARTDVGNTLLQSYTSATSAEYVISGTSNSFNSVGVNDAMLYKTDAVGNLLWTRMYGRSNREEGFEVTAKADPGYALTGYVSSFGAGGPDIYLVNTDINGKSGTPCEMSPQQTVIANQPCIISSAVWTNVASQFDVTSAYKGVDYLLDRCSSVTPSPSSAARTQALGVHPNPATSEVRLEYDAEFEGAQVQILNLQGKPVKRMFVLGGEGKYQLNVNDLEKGMYLIRVIKADGKTENIRFIKQ